MLLDPPTLLFTAAIVIAFSGVLLLAAPRPAGDTKVLAVWGMAMLVGTSGLVLTGAGTGTVGDWPEPYVTIAGLLGTVLIVLATGISWTAARLFREKQARPVLMILGPALWVATHPWHQASPRWVALSSLIGAVYTLATAFELWQTHMERLPSRIAAMALLLIHAIIFVGHALSALVGSEPTQRSLIGPLILESLLHTNGMAFLLLAMVKERAELRSNEQLRALTRLDGLTGIGNRRHFDEQLSAEMRRADHGGSTLALLLIDVDRFKSYNDAVGHQQGDACLRDVARTIAQHIRRPGDLAARYGGEEFAIVMANTDPDTALDLAEQVRVAIETMTIPHPATDGVVTVSIGVAVLLPGAAPNSGEDLVGQADRALYEAKGAGRNIVRASWLIAGEYAVE